jgi:hypothetical protein
MRQGEARHRNASCVRSPVRCGLFRDTYMSMEYLSNSEVQFMWFSATRLILIFIMILFANRPAIAKPAQGELVASRNLIEGLKNGQVPQASSRGVLPTEAYLQCPNSCAKLSDIASMLQQALGKAGYSQQAWYLIDEHNKNVTVAVLTQLEQIQSDGRPSANKARWIINYSSKQIDSLGAFIKTLIKGSSPGRYRSFLFGISRSSSPLTNVGPMWSSRRTDQEFSGIRDALRGGNRVPLLSNLSSIRTSNAFYVYVFVYEYEISSVDGSVTFVKDSSITAIDHLKRSGIWQALRLK